MVTSPSLDECGRKPLRRNSLTVCSGFFTDAARVVLSGTVMKVAIPTLDDRVSPVFDVAQAAVVVELQGGRELRRQTVLLYARDIARRVAELSQYEVKVLICGAISRPLEAMLQSARILVIPQICGQVDDVLQAFIADRLNDRIFLMPGCCGRRRRSRCGARERAGRGRRAAPEQAKPEI